MYYMTESDYKKIVSKIKTYPYSFPRLDMKEELKVHTAFYIGWAIWCLYGLPEPKTEKERESVQMVKDYLDANLKIVPDEEKNTLEIARWSEEITCL